MQGEERAAAVNSMVYEASARVIDPVHGCATEFSVLQKRIAELESQLAATQSDLNHLWFQYDKLARFLGIESPDSELVPYPAVLTSEAVENIMYEEADSMLPLGPLWEP